ncbi:MAG: deoxyguanosinetriphosphate triphosphohydrolase [Rickettsiales bacterium]|nr:MAG: deoxyguanosinetriphosphate triphosphohydrolase [Rickettsiales bacterium]
MLKQYACLPENSRGRIHPEDPTPYRNEFERDRDRIIHANAFKRLQYKTQVFVNHEGDHYRNRMTHSMEVSSIARSLSKTLGLSEDLAESVALAHDLGHSPFGHAGEHALNECMKDFGGFSHNAHSFKILTNLEHKYAAFDGLNLTWEVLEGIVKHNGPVINEKSYEYVYEYNDKHGLDLEKYSSAEAQVASLADDIAYICHDLEDSIRAKIVSYRDLEELEFIDKYIHEVRAVYPNIADNRLIYEIGRKLTHHLIDSLLLQTNRNLKSFKIETESDIRNHKRQIVEFTPSIFEEVKQIKDFLMRKVYKHHEVAYVTLQSQNVVRKLFKLYVDNIELMPFSWRNMIAENNLDSKMSIIADYIAGMTDRYAIKQYQSFFNLSFANKGL